MIPSLKSHQRDHTPPMPLFIFDPTASHLIFLISYALKWRPTLSPPVFSRVWLVSSIILCPPKSFFFVWLEQRRAFSEGQGEGVGQGQRRSHGVWGFLCEWGGTVTKGLIGQVLFSPLIKQERRKHAAVAHMKERSGTSLWNFKWIAIYVFFSQNYWIV